MWSLREEVTSREDCSSLAAVSDGILIPNPPSRAGRAKTAHSRSLGGGLPVSAGSRSDLSISSRGDSRWPMLGVAWGPATAVVSFMSLRRLLNLQKVLNLDQSKTTNSYRSSQSCRHRNRKSIIRVHVHFYLQRNFC